MNPVKRFQTNYKHYIINLKKIADTDVGSLHKVNFRGMHGYYHHVNGSPREISLITHSNIQRYANKNGGEGKYVKQIMKHHANTHGELKSDDIQSIGGMNLWKSLYHEKDPNFTFHHYHNLKMNGDTEIYDKNKIDDKYLEDKEGEIWHTTREKGEKHRIGMTPNV